MRQCKIYGLVDAQGIVRNVGKTEDSLKRRLQGHLSKARRGFVDYRCNWIRSLQEPPKIVLIEEFLFEEKAEWEVREKYWIALFRAYGHKLTNTTPGGGGVGSGENHPWFGRAHTRATRAKMSKALAGKPKSPEHREALSSRARLLGPNKNSTTGLKGVSWNPHTQKYCARIRVKGNYVQEYFSTLEEAGLARDIAVALHCPLGSYLNYPPAQVSATGPNFCPTLQ